MVGKKIIRVTHYDFGYVDFQKDLLSLRQQEVLKDLLWKEKTLEIHKPFIKLGVELFNKQQFKKKRNGRKES